jgi:hypothetical protein
VNTPKLSVAHSQSAQSAEKAKNTEVKRILNGVLHSKSDDEFEGLMHDIIRLDPTAGERKPFRVVE